MTALTVRPSKIVAVGRNYVLHARELGNEPPVEPLFFLKAPSALLGDGEAIVLPAGVGRVDFEGELAVVIGRRARNVQEPDALSVVAGYTCANDVTARDLQKRDGQWTRAKGFDTFCPVGPKISSGLDPNALILETRVNGAVRQHAETSALIFSVARLIVSASAVMTLEAGDLLLTGTPEGVGPLVPGDTVEVEISGIGVLRNPVRAASS